MLTGQPLWGSKRKLFFDSRTRSQQKAPCISLTKTNITLSKEQYNPCEILLKLKSLLHVSSTNKLSVYHTIWRCCLFGFDLLHDDVNNAYNNKKHWSTKSNKYDYQHHCGKGIIFWSSIPYHSRPKKHNINLKNLNNLHKYILSSVVK